MINFVEVPIFFLPSYSWTDGKTNTDRRADKQADRQTDREMDEQTIQKATWKAGWAKETLLKGTAPYT